MDFTIRKATEQDYEGLSKIFAEVDTLHAEELPHVFVEPEEIPRGKEFVSGIIADENAAFFVAEHNSQVVGLIHVAIRESPAIPIMVQRRYAYVEAVAVTQQLRGRGVGRALMEEAQLWSIQKKASQVELNVWDFNERAITFFKRLGYNMIRHGMWKPIK